MDLYMSADTQTIFRRILCPTDLSADSDEAIGCGIKLARSFGAKLFVCHSMQPCEAAVSEREVEKLLESAIIRRAGGASPADLEWESIVTEGEAAIAIAREAAARCVDLIVICSRRLQTALSLGSTAESLCRTAPCPVLVIRHKEEGLEEKPISEIMPKRVLVAHDFSSGAELALSYGLSLAEGCRAELHLIHVLPPRAKSEAPELAFLPLSVESGFHKSAALLQKAVPAGTHPSCEVKHEVREGPPYREVLAYAEEREIDLICMGASGAGFGMRALFGSNADRVLRQAPCPVLIARPLKPACAVPNCSGD